MNCLTLFLYELGSHPRSPAFTFITAFIFAIAFTFAVAVTLAILFAVVFTAVVINLQEKLTAKLLSRIPVNIYSQLIGSGNVAKHPLQAALWKHSCQAVLP